MTEREATKRPLRSPCHDDGPNDTVSSMSILLEWLTEGDNHNRWRGEKGGSTKASLAQEITARMHARGIKHVRKPKDIITKISLLEKAFQKTDLWKSGTGAGITNETSLREAVTQKFPHYYTLEPVFGDGPRVRPLLTTDDDNQQEETQVDEVALRPAEDESCLTQQATPRRSPTRRSRSSSVASSAAEWSEMSDSYMRAKQQELELQRAQFQKTSMLEERRVLCNEKESRCRVQLLAAQACREEVSTKREEMQMRIDLARGRKRIRDEGVDQAEIDKILPIPD
ncbi:TPA: hypothetical protein N0F65_003863 [Lagenidium giganteum]|uniref:Uncharacterized protein n=1 Tax=Lagenidium giganteum TaxID=4803 RepID=A0AAV2Z834_9STRA|nr:TPA: hypothetical protein N0F65_003863 [Lagenidium giganteum]